MAGKRFADIAPELIVEGLTEGNEVHGSVQVGLPPGTRILDATYYRDWVSGGGPWVRLLLESDAWPDLREGDMIPGFAPVIRQLRCGGQP